MYETLVFMCYGLVVTALATAVGLGLAFIAASLRFGSAIDHAEARSEVARSVIDFYVESADKTGRIGWLALAFLAALVADGVVMPSDLLRAVLAVGCAAALCACLARGLGRFRMLGESYRFQTGFTVEDASNEVLGSLPRLKARE